MKYATLLVFCLFSAGVRTASGVDAVCTQDVYFVKNPIYPDNVTTQVYWREIFVVGSDGSETQLFQRVHKTYSPSIRRGQIYATIDDIRPFVENFEFREGCWEEFGKGFEMVLMNQDKAPYDEVFSLQSYMVTNFLRIADSVQVTTNNVETTMGRSIGHWESCYDEMTKMKTVVNNRPYIMMLADFIGRQAPLEIPTEQEVIEAVWAQYANVDIGDNWSEPRRRFREVLHGARNRHASWSIHNSMVRSFRRRAFGAMKLMLRTARLRGMPLADAQSLWSEIIRRGRITDEELSDHNQRDYNQLR